MRWKFWTSQNISTKDSTAWQLGFTILWLLQRSKLSLHRCMPVENQKVSTFKVIWSEDSKTFFGYYGYHSLTWSRLVSSRCLKCWMVWCLSLCRALSNFCKHFCTRWVLGVFSLRAFKKEKNKLWIFLSIVELNVPSTINTWKKLLSTVQWFGLTKNGLVSGRLQIK